MSVTVRKKEKILRASSPEGSLPSPGEWLYFELSISGQPVDGRWTTGEIWQSEGSKWSSWLQNKWKTLKKKKAPSLNLTDKAKNTSDLYRINLFESLLRSCGPGTDDWWERYSDEGLFLAECFKLPLVTFVEQAFEPYMMSLISEDFFDPKLGKTNHISDIGIYFIDSRSLILPAVVKFIDSGFRKSLIGASVVVYDLRKSLPWVVEQYVDLYKKSKDLRHPAKRLQITKTAIERLLVSAEQFLKSLNDFEFLDHIDIDEMQRGRQGIDPFLPGKPHFTVPQVKIKSQKLAMLDSALSGQYSTLADISRFLSPNSQNDEEKSESSAFADEIFRNIILPLENVLRHLPAPERGRQEEVVRNELIKNLVETFDAFSGWWRANYDLNTYKLCRRLFVHECVSGTDAAYGHTDVPDFENTDGMNKDIQKISIPKIICEDIGSKAARKIRRSRGLPRE